MSANYKQREAYIIFLKGWYSYPRGEIDRALEYLNSSIKMQEELGLKQDISQKVSYETALKQLSEIYREP